MAAVAAGNSRGVNAGYAGFDVCSAAVFVYRFATAALLGRNAGQARTTAASAPAAVNVGRSVSFGTDAVPFGGVRAANDFGGGTKRSLHGRAEPPPSHGAHGMHAAADSAKVFTARDLERAVDSALGAYAINHDPPQHLCGAPRVAFTAPPATESVPPRQFFSRKITSTSTTEVIKELRAGFKQYIPLSLITHAACVRATRRATRSGDTFDTEVNFGEQGILLKRKSFSPAKDLNLSMHELAEVRENFVRGMRRHLILGGDVLPGETVAQECAAMFDEFFQACMRQRDFSEDWLSYNGFIIESYTVWVGRRDDSYGLIFDEHDLTQFTSICLALAHLRSKY